MAVYVDDAMIAADVPNGPVVHHSRWSHLWADTEQELHDFAVNRLGLRRSYFQPAEDHHGFAHYDLTDTIPAALDVAIPRGSRTPAGTGAIAWHQFNRATFAIGREQITIPGSDQTIGMYSAERSIADAFRLRGEVGYELARDALREWLRRGGKPARLIEIAARLPRAKSPVLQALEMLG